LDDQLKVAKDKLNTADRNLKNTHSQIVKLDLVKRKLEGQVQSNRIDLKALLDRYEDAKRREDEEVTLGRLAHLVEQLQKAAPSNLLDIVEQITAEINGHDSLHRERRISYLTHEVQTASSLPGFQVRLYLSLFEVEKDPKWQTQMRILASQHALEDWPTFKVLLTRTVFDYRSQADIVCQSYTSYLQNPQNPKIPGKTYEIREELLSLGPGPVIWCRKPFLDKLIEQHKDYPSTDEEQAGLVVHANLWINNHSNEVPDAVPQAAMVWYLVKHPHFNPKDFEVSHFTAEDAALYKYPSGVVEALRTGSAEEWLRNNEELVKAWTEEDLSLILQCSDSVMAKILRGEWITVRDLPVGFAPDED
jgi:hypothetical protein